MYDKLKDIFLNVNEWLKFAETKHATLIALNGAALFGLLSSYSNIKEFKGIEVAIVLGIFLFGISILNSFISFFPKTSNTIKISNTTRTVNLFFWGHVCALTTQQFIIELRTIDSNYNPTKLEEDMMNQIIVNSQIVERKYRLFKYSLYSSTFGITIQLIYLIIKILWHL